MKRRTFALLAAGASLALVRAPHETSLEELSADLDGILGGERATFQGRYGAQSYRSAGAGAPLVLVHGINAAASSYEMRCNFSSLSAHFHVYAPDLLGFGLSERPDRHYTPQIYIDQLQAFLRDVVGEPAHLVASSLSGAYAVAMAHAHPDLVRSLVLICPTGIKKLSGPPTNLQRVIDVLFGLPLIGRTLFSLLISRPSVRYYLRSMAYYDRKQVTAEMVDLQHRLGQRPGARFAPRGFVSGSLNMSIAEQFADLQQPILLAWGKNATVTPLADAPSFLERNPRATLKVFDMAGLLPHDEQAVAFNAYITDWIQENII